MELTFLLIVCPVLHFGYSDKAIEGHGCLSARQLPASERGAATLTVMEYGRGPRGRGAAGVRLPSPSVPAAGIPLPVLYIETGRELIVCTPIARVALCSPGALCTPLASAAWLLRGYCRRNQPPIVEPTAKCKEPPSTGL